MFFHLALVEVVFHCTAAYTRDFAFVKAFLHPFQTLLRGCSLRNVTPLQFRRRVFMRHLHLMRYGFKLNCLPLSLSLPLFLLSLTFLYYHIHFYIKTQVDIQALAHAVELTRQGAVDSLRFAKGDLFQAFQVTFQIFMTYYLC